MAPEEVTFSVGGALLSEMNIVSYSWDFGDGQQETGQNPSHIYKDHGYFTVTLTILDDEGQDHVYHEKITVRAPHIDVIFPDGPESLYVEFSTPDRDCESHPNLCVKSYSWDYGDGSPVEYSRHGDHHYTSSQAYTVTLTLTLDDNSTVQGQKVIFVGPGSRYIPGHTVYGDETWYAGGTYILTGPITVAQEGRLAIEPGSIVKLNNGGKIYVYGTLSASGVTFTWADGTNEWRGIEFSDSGASGSVLENCVIEHASGSYNNSAAVNIHGSSYLDSSSPTIKGCTLRDSSATYGIFFINGSPEITGNSISGFNHGIYAGSNVSGSFSPTVTNNTFAANEYGLTVGSIGGIYQDNTFTGNTSYGLYYSGNGVLDATYNDWGDVSGPLDSSDDCDSGGFYNPDGLGDRVSDHVKYYPWIGQDSDSDGLPDYLEDDTGTLSFDADTDDDGIPDGIEDKNLNGQVDAGETDPRNPDTDMDGIQDGTELGYTLSDIGTDTDTAFFQPDMDLASLTNPLNDDTDNDGIPDGVEDANLNGRIDEGETNPADLSLQDVTLEFGRMECETPTWCHADLDADGDVDGNDLAIFARTHAAGP